MRPVRVVVPAGPGGTSPIVPIDFYEVGTITIGVDPITGAPSTAVQYTLADIFDPVALAAATWITAGAPLAAVVGSAAAALCDANGNAIHPTAIRGVNSVAGATSRLTVIVSGLRA